MEIEIRFLENITPCLASRGGPHGALRVNVTMEEFQAEHLFYQLWEYYGDKTFKSWINAEGYTFEKREKTNQ